jgi:hypothetical protein
MEIKNLVKQTTEEVVYIDGAFDKSKEFLETKGYAVASIQKIAKARIEQGKDAEVSRNSGWTKEGFVYVLKDNEFRLTLNSPIMANTKDATNATDSHRSGKEFYLTPKQLERAIADSVKVSGEPVPTNRFGENEAIVFIFKKTAQKYGEFLEEAGIKEMPVHLPTIQEKSFARQLWFRSLYSDSEVSGNWILDFDDGTFGVSASADKGSASMLRDFAPSLKDILNYSNQFVPEPARKEFEKGLEALFRKQ